MVNQAINGGIIDDFVVFSAYLSIKIPPGIACLWVKASPRVAVNCKKRFPHLR